MKTACDLKTSYDKNGYVVVDNIYHEDDLLRMGELFEGIRVHGNEFELRGDQNQRKATFEEVDKNAQQVRVIHPHRTHPEALEWYLHPRVADVLEQLLGRPPLGAQTMFYYKPPGARGQGMHQDNFYLLAHPSTCIACWTPLDDADDENGCLWVVPGSNRGDILCPKEGEQERWLQYGDSHISEFPRDRKPIPVPVKRSQSLFFSGNLIHGSGPNRSKDRWRRTFIGHYVDDVTDTLSRFYHPVLNMQGETVSHVQEASGGGPCGENWRGAAH